MSVWRKPVARGLFEHTYKFRVPDASAVKECQRAITALPSSLFKPDLKNPTIDFKDISGYGAPS